MSRVKGKRTLGVRAAQGAPWLLCVTSAAVAWGQANVGGTRPMPASEPRPSAAAVDTWKARRFGMFIHFGVYSELGGVWQGKEIKDGYSEQIMANAPISREQYAAEAKRFDPEKFDADAIAKLAKAAGMRFVVITAKHHDGFAMWGTKQSDFNVVEGTPFHRDVLREMAEACRREGLKFGVYYSTIDWHAPTGSAYQVGNSNEISDAHAAFNVRQLKELLTGYGPLSEIWFDMGKPTPAQSALFAQTVHRAQRETMVSGRVFNYQGDFTVMGDNEVPKFAIDEPWQTPASMFAETWGYRSWQRRGSVDDKVHEKLEELATVVSRGGNYILNIGPEGDGSVVPFEAEVLRGMGLWLRRNGEAVFGKGGDEAPGASPFRSVDFGYVTEGRGHLYLFVKQMPADGTLRLPGVRSELGAPAVLGGARGTTAMVTEDPQGAAVRVDELLRGEKGFLPVVELPFSGELRVRPDSLVRADAGGTFRLKAEAADRFLNYNGRGYEAQATVYKLRWWTAAEPGRYRITVHYAKAATGGVLSAVAGAEAAALRTEAGDGDGESVGELVVGKGSAARDGAVAVEITPKEPFVKGTALRVTVRDVALERIR